MFETYKNSPSYVNMNKCFKIEEAELNTTKEIMLTFPFVETSYFFKNEK